MMVSRADFAIAASLSLVACDCRGGEEGTEAPAPLRVGVSAAPKTLDPRFATDATGMRIAHDLLFSSLASVGFDLRVEPNLATHWDTPDDRTYLFHLRKATFHDGSPVTAEDVKFTFDHLMDPGTKSPFRSTYQELIASVEVVTSTVVRFNLRRPSATFLTNMNASILPKRWVTEDEARFRRELIGSGPFRLVKQDPSAVILAAHHDYFGEGPHVEKVRIEMIQDDNTRFLKLKKGALDLVVNALPRARIARFRTDEDLRERYEVMVSPGVAFKYLALNLRDPQLSKLPVRQALAYAIDPEEIIEFRLDGYARAARSMLADINAFAAKDLPAYTHDPEKARALLDEAGYPDPDGPEGPEARFRLELKTSTNQEVIGIARVLQAQLEEVGVDIEIRSFEWGTFYGDVKQGNFQIASMRWVGVTDPDFYYEIFHSSMAPPMGRNRGFFRNATMDDLVMRGRAELRAEARKAIYDDVQRLAAAELPYINLWHEANVSIVARRVEGYRAHPQGGFDSFHLIRLGP